MSRSVSLFTGRNQQTFIVIICVYWQWSGDITSRHVSTGNTVLHVGCAAGHVDVVQFLIPAYSDCTDELMNMYDDLPANLLNFDGFTPLMLAASRGTYQYCTFLSELATVLIWWHKLYHCVCDAYDDDGGGGGN